MSVQRGCANQGAEAEDSEEGTQHNIVENPFVYPELTAGIKQRAHAQNMLVQYMSQTQDEFRQIHERFSASGGPSNPDARLRYAKEMDALDKKVHRDTQVAPLWSDDLLYNLYKT